MEEGNDYFLFMPRSKRGLLADYPELKKHEEFLALNNTQLLFVWCYACKGGPYFHENISEEELLTRCIKVSRYKFDDAKAERTFMSGKFPHKLRAAVEVMKTFEPTVRFRAKKILERAIKNIEKIISIDLGQDGESIHFLDKDGNAEWSKKKIYIDSAIRANSELPKMIEQAERGYGITDSKDKIKKNIDESGLTFLEKWHSLN